MFLRFSCGEAKKRTHFTDQTWDLFELPCKTFTIIPQKETELENFHMPDLENVTTTFYHTEPSTLSLETNTVKISSATLDIYGGSKEDQEENMTKK